MDADSVLTTFIIFNVFHSYLVNKVAEAMIDYQTNNINYWEHRYSRPYFEQSESREVIVAAGHTAFLPCKVRNLGDRAVSWIRKGDLHILTVGILTYTNDQRFQTVHTDGTDEWTLKITSTQITDTGTYECQVSTEPKISLAFRLSVVISKAEILGNSEIYVKTGSDINLTCTVMLSAEPPSFIFWYKNKNVINYSSRGGINVLTEKQTKTSRLLISRAQPPDSGNYTCLPSSSESASVVVHVLHGEHPAAMQHGNSGMRKGSTLLPSAMIFVCFIVEMYLLQNTVAKVTLFGVDR